MDRKNELLDKFLDNTLSREEVLKQTLEVIDKYLKSEL